MDAQTFFTWLAGLDGSGVRMLARRIHESERAGDDVAWWDATTAIGKALRTDGKTRAGAAMARRAVSLVTAVSMRGELRPAHEDVCAVAHRAADIARALAAAPSLDVELRILLATWAGALPEPAAA